MALSDVPPHSWSRVLGLFAKQPRLGQVKTRLAAELSAEAATRIAEAFLRDTVERLAQIVARRLLVFAPPDAQDYFSKIANGRFLVAPQSSGDLGERMVSCIEEALAAGAKSVVLVGTDSPTLPPEFIEQAFAALEKTDLVLGPATDGGYYLIGCSRSLPKLFAGVAWGSSQVLAETLARFDGDGGRLALLPPWYDVDTLNDWTMLRGHVTALRRAGLDPGVPYTEQLLQSLVS